MAARHADDLLLVEAASEEEIPLFPEHRQGLRQHHWQRLTVVGLVSAGLLLAMLAGASSLMPQGWQGGQRAILPEVMGAAEEGGTAAAGTGKGTANMTDALKKAAKNAAEAKKQISTSLFDARKTVREAALKLKAEGKSEKDIKAKGYTRANLGCKRMKSEAPVMKRCLEQLKTGFTPRELVELLELKSDHDFLMLSHEGLHVKTDDWKIGRWELMCFSKGTEGGCVYREVHIVKEDNVTFHHVSVDPSTGKGKFNGFDFTIYSLKEWK